MWVPLGALRPRWVEEKGLAPLEFGDPEQNLPPGVCWQGQTPSAELYVPDLEACSAVPHLPAAFFLQTLVCQPSL